MKIKALSLWEPWASLMRTGAKTIETRTWSTSYRGPLLICAAARHRKKEIQEVLSNWGVQLGLQPLIGVTRHPDWGAGRWSRKVDKSKLSVVPERLSFGNAVTIVDLVDCRPTVSLDPKEYWGEEKFGNYSPGRYAWFTENRRTFEPFPVKGRQGLFEVEIDPDILEVTP